MWFLVQQIYKRHGISVLVISMIDHASSHVSMISNLYSKIIKKLLKEGNKILNIE